MGCQLLGCSNNFSKDAKLTNINHNFFEIESNALTYRSKPGSTTDRSFGLTNTSTLFTNDKNTKPTLTKLNFSNLIVPQQSDRSFTSHLTTINETKEKVLSLLSERNGKTFKILSKEINFSLKLIQKLNKINTPSKFHNYNSNTIDNVDISFCSNVSDYKIQTNSNNHNLSLAHSGDFSFKNNNDINRSSKISFGKLNKNVSLFNKFKTLFYIPLISLTGEIENFFSLENFHNKGDNVSSNINVIQMKSFSVYFDFFETFFTYILNLFQNLNYNTISYKNEFIKLTSFLMDIQKIKIQFFPNSNLVSLSFYYLQEDFYSHFIGDCNKKYINLNDDNEIFKNIEKECLTIIFSTSENEKLPGFCRYKIWYRNINMSNNDFLKILEEYLSTKVNSKELIQHFKTISSKYTRNCGFVIGFAILVDEYGIGNMQSCGGFEIKIKTNHDKLVGLSEGEVNGEGSWDNEEGKDYKEEDNEVGYEGGKMIRFNKSYCQVLYLVITANQDSVRLSYEYSFK